MLTFRPAPAMQKTDQVMNLYVPTAKLVDYAEIDKAPLTQHTKTAFRNELMAVLEKKREALDAEQMREAIGAHHALTRRFAQAVEMADAEALEAGLMEGQELAKGEASGAGGEVLTAKSGNVERSGEGGVAEGSTKA